MGVRFVNLLLDTHVLIWAQQDSSKLGKRTRRALLNSNNALWISSVTSLELSRLVWGNRLELGRSISEWMQQAIDSLGLNTNPMDNRIAIEAYQLPEPIHSDPADRLLLATTRIHGHKLVTADDRLLNYPHAMTVAAEK